jgi:hypothetical protein
MPALAEHLFDGCESDTQVVVDGLEVLAGELRCDSEAEPNPDMWPWDNPLWQKGGTPMRGCEVHESLAAKLHEDREFVDGVECTDRPRNKCKDRPPKNQNNDVQGASGDIANGKYEAADTKLGSFLNDIYKARENESFQSIDGMNFKNWRTAFVNHVNRARECIAPLLP